MQARLATGHNQTLKPVANPVTRRHWPRRRASVDSQRYAEFVAANLGLKKSPLLEAMQTAQQSWRETGQADLVYWA
jgi:hypothetical protein